METFGHCHCRATSWAFAGAPNFSYFCHCDDCRRNCAAPVVAWLGVARADFRWTGAAPRARQSKPGVHRYFCASCGAPMGFEADRYPGEIALYAATLAKPEEFEPTFHVNYDAKLPWLALDDDLPKYAGTRAEQSDLKP